MNAQSRTLSVCPFNVAKHDPFETVQSLRVSSSDAESAMQAFLFVTSTLTTASSCP